MQQQQQQRGLVARSADNRLYFRAQVDTHTQQQQIVNAYYNTAHTHARARYAAPPIPSVLQEFQGMPIYNIRVGAHTHTHTHARHIWVKSY